MKLISIRHHADPRYHCDSVFIGIIIALFMISVSSFIAFRSFKTKTFQNYIQLFGAIAIGGTFNTFFFQLNDKMSK
ncbi:hypothetical protein KKA17_02350 [bacterium]|nr:hypothetical protein [bacterium]MBU1884318.1 hypothetical protein [bacterium]